MDTEDSININNAIIYTIDEFILLGRCRQNLDFDKYNQLQRQSKAFFTLDELKKYDQYNVITPELSKKYRDKLSTYKDVIVNDSRLDISDCSLNYTTNTFTLYKNEHLIIPSYIFLDAIRIINYGTIHNAGYIKCSQIINDGFIYNNGTFEITNTTTATDTNLTNNQKTLFHNSETATFCNFNKFVFMNTGNKEYSEIKQNGFVDSTTINYDLTSNTSVTPLFEFTNINIYNNETGTINIDGSFTLINTNLINKNIIIQQPGSLLQFEKSILMQYFIHICEGIIEFKDKDSKYNLDKDYDLDISLPIFINKPIDTIKNIINDGLNFKFEKNTMYFDIFGNGSENIIIGENSNSEYGINIVINIDDIGTNSVTQTVEYDTYVYNDLTISPIGNLQTIVIQKNQILILNGETKIYGNILNLGTIIIYGRLYCNYIVNMGTIYNKGTIINKDNTIFYNICNGMIWNTNELGITSEKTLYDIQNTDECEIKRELIKKQNEDIIRSRFVLTNYLNIDYKTLRILKNQTLHINGKLDNYDIIMNDGELIIDNGSLLMNFGIIYNNHHIIVKGTIDNTYGVIYNNKNIIDKNINTGYNLNNGKLVYNSINATHIVNDKVIYPYTKKNTFDIYSIKDIDDRDKLVLLDISNTFLDITNSSYNPENTYILHQNTRNGYHNTIDISNDTIRINGYNLDITNIMLLKGEYHFKLNLTGEQSIYFDTSGMSDPSNIYVTSESNTNRINVTYNNVNTLFYGVEKITSQDNAIKTEKNDLIIRIKGDLTGLKMVYNDSSAEATTNLGNFDNLYYLNTIPITDVSELDINTDNNIFTLYRNQKLIIKDNLTIPYSMNIMGHINIDPSLCITIPYSSENTDYNTFTMQNYSKFVVNNSEVKLLSICNFKKLSTIEMNNSIIDFTDINNVSKNHKFHNTFLGNDKSTCEIKTNVYDTIDIINTFVNHNVKITGNATFKTKEQLQDYVFDTSNNHIKFHRSNKTLRTLSYLQTTLDVYKDDSNYIFDNIKQLVEKDSYINIEQYCVFIDENTDCNINIINYGDILVDKMTTITMKKVNSFIQNKGTFLINKDCVLILDEYTTFLNYGTLINNGTILIKYGSRLYNENYIENNGIIENNGTIKNISLLKGSGEIANKKVFENQLIPRNKETYKTNFQAAKTITITRITSDDNFAKYAFTRRLIQTTDDTLLYNQFWFSDSLQYEDSNNDFIKIFNFPVVPSSQDIDINIFLGIKDDGLYKSNNKGNSFIKIFETSVQERKLYFHNSYIYNTFCQTKDSIIWIDTNDELNQYFYKSETFLKSPSKYLYVFSNEYSDYFHTVDFDLKVRTIEKSINNITNSSNIYVNISFNLIKTIYFATYNNGKTFIISKQHSIYDSKIYYVLTIYTSSSNYTNYIIGIHNSLINFFTYDSLSKSKIIDYITEIYGIISFGSNNRYILINCRFMTDYICFRIIDTSSVISDISDISALYAPIYDENLNYTTDTKNVIKYKLDDNIHKTENSIEIVTINNTVLKIEVDNTQSKRHITNNILLEIYNEYKDSDLWIFEEFRYYLELSYNNTDDQIHGNIPIYFNELLFYANQNENNKDRINIDNNILSIDSVLTFNYYTANIYYTVDLFGTIIKTEKRTTLSETKNIHTKMNAFSNRLKHYNDMNRNTYENYEKIINDRSIFDELDDTNKSKFKPNAGIENKTENYQDININSLDLDDLLYIIVEKNEKSKLYYNNIAHLNIEFKGNDEIKKIYDVNISNKPTSDYGIDLNNTDLSQIQFSDISLSINLKDMFVYIMKKYTPINDIGARLTKPYGDVDLKSKIQYVSIINYNFNENNNSSDNEVLFDDASFGQFISEDYTYTDVKTYELIKDLSTNKLIKLDYKEILYIKSGKTLTIQNTLDVYGVLIIEKGGILDITTTSNNGNSPKIRIHNINTTYIDNETVIPMIMNRGTVKYHYESNIFNNGIFNNMGVLELDKEDAPPHQLVTNLPKGYYYNSDTSIFRIIHHQRENNIDKHSYFLLDYEGKGSARDIQLEDQNDFTELVPRNNKMIIHNNICYAIDSSNYLYYSSNGYDWTRIYIEIETTLGNKKYANVYDVLSCNVDNIQTLIVLMSTYSNDIEKSALFEFIGNSSYHLDNFNYWRRISSVFDIVDSNYVKIQSMNNVDSSETTICIFDNSNNNNNIDNTTITKNATSTRPYQFKLIDTKIKHIQTNIIDSDSSIYFTKQDQNQDNVYKLYYLSNNINLITYFTNQNDVKDFYLWNNNLFFIDLSDNKLKLKQGINNNTVTIDEGLDEVKYFLKVDHNIVASDIYEKNKSIRSLKENYLYYVKGNYLYRISAKNNYLEETTYGGTLVNYTETNTSFWKNKIYIVDEILRNGVSMFAIPIQKQPQQLDRFARIITLKKLWLENKAYFNHTTKTYSLFDVLFIHPYETLIIETGETLEVFKTNNTEEKSGFIVNTGTIFIRSYGELINNHYILNSNIINNNGIFKTNDNSETINIKSSYILNNGMINNLGIIYSEYSAIIKNDINGSIYNTIGDESGEIRVHKSNNKVYDIFKYYFQTNINTTNQGSPPLNSEQLTNEINILIQSYSNFYESIRFNIDEEYHNIIDSINDNYNILNQQNEIRNDILIYDESIDYVTNRSYNKKSIAYQYKSSFIYSFDNTLTFNSKNNIESDNLFIDHYHTFDTETVSIDSSTNFVKLDYPSIMLPLHRPIYIDKYKTIELTIKNNISLPTLYNFGKLILKMDSTVSNIKLNNIYNYGYIITHLADDVQLKQMSDTNILNHGVIENFLGQLHLTVGIEYVNYDKLIDNHTDYLYYTYYDISNTDVFDVSQFPSINTYEKKQELLIKLKDAIGYVDTNETIEYIANETYSYINELYSEINNQILDIIIEASNSSFILDNSFNTYYSTIIDYHNNLNNSDFSFSTFNIFLKSLYSDIDSNIYFKKYKYIHTKNNVENKKLLYLNNILELYNITFLLRLFLIELDPYKPENEHNKKTKRLLRYYFNFIYHKVEWLYNTLKHIQQVKTFGSLYKPESVISYGTFIQTTGILGRTFFYDVNGIDISENNITSYISNKQVIQDYKNILSTTEQPLFISDLSNQIKDTITLTKNTKKWFTLFDIDSIYFSEVETIDDQSMYRYRFKMSKDLSYNNNEHVVVNPNSLLSGTDSLYTITLNNTSMYIYGTLYKIRFVLNNSTLIIKSDYLLPNNNTDTNDILLDISLNSSTLKIKTTYDYAERNVSISQDDKSFVMTNKTDEYTFKVSEHQLLSNVMSLSELSYNILYKNNVLYDPSTNILYDPSTNIYYLSNIRLPKDSQLYIKENERVVVTDESVICGNIHNYGELRFGIDTETNITRPYNENENSFVNKQDLLQIWLTSISFTTLFDKLLQSPFYDSLFLNKENSLVEFIGLSFACLMTTILYYNGYSLVENTDLAQLYSISSYIENNIDFTQTYKPFYNDISNQSITIPEVPVFKPISIQGNIINYKTIFILKETHHYGKIDIIGDAKIEINSKFVQHNLGTIIQDDANKIIPSSYSQINTINNLYYLDHPDFSNIVTKKILDKEGRDEIINEMKTVLDNGDILDDSFISDVQYHHYEISDNLIIQKPDYLVIRENEIVTFVKDGKITSDEVDGDNTIELSVLQMNNLINYGYIVIDDDTPDSDENIRNKTLTSDDFFKGFKVKGEENVYLVDKPLSLANGNTLIIEDGDTIKLSSYINNSGLIKIKGSIEFVNSYSRILNRNEIFVYKNSSVDPRNIINYGKIGKIYNYINQNEQIHNGIIEFERYDFNDIQWLYIDNVNPAYTIKYVNSYSSDNHFTIHYNRDEQYFYINDDDLNTYNANTSTSINGFYIFFFIKNNRAYIKIKTNQLRLFDRYKTNANSIKVSDILCNGFLHDIKDIIHNNHSSCAVKYDGEVVCWGHHNNGGEFPYKQVISAVKLGNSEAICQKYSNETIEVIVFSNNSDLNNKYNPPEIKGLRNILKVFDNDDYFVALDRDGTVYKWGEGFEQVEIIKQKNIHKSQIIDAGINHYVYDKNTKTFI